MEVQVRTYTDALVAPLEGGQAFEIEPGIFDVLAEISSRTPRCVVGVKAIAVGKDELANIVAMDELAVGTLSGYERRPIRLTLRSLGDVPVLSIHLYVVFDVTKPADDFMPSGMLSF